MRQTRHPRMVLAGMLVLCAAGAGISGLLVKQGAGPWPTGATEPGLMDRLCGTRADGVSNCAAVLESPWSTWNFRIPKPTLDLEIRWSRVEIPLAFIGLAYFVFLGSWLAFTGGPRAWGKLWYLVPLGAVVCGVATSIALTWVMFVDLDARCMICLVVHGINAFLLVGVLSLRPDLAFDSTESNEQWTPSETDRYSEQTSVRDHWHGLQKALSCSHEQARDPYRLKPMVACKTVGFALLLILGMWVYRDAKLEIRRQVAGLIPYKNFVEQRKYEPAFLLAQYYAQPQYIIPHRNHEERPDPSEMIPSLVVFGDYECSTCACFSGKLRNEFLPRWQGPFDLSFRHLPLGRECNGGVTGDVHPQACRAGYAAEAARMQGGDDAFWRMHQLLFSNRRQLGRVSYESLAQQAGLDGRQLLADMSGDAVRAIIKSDIALADTLGVQDTPAVMLNGRRVPQVCLYNPVFWEAVSREFNGVATATEADNHACPADGPAENRHATHRSDPLAIRSGG